MDEQSEGTCEIYITPDERRLLAKVARGRGIGRDYLALRMSTGWTGHAVRRPIPGWLVQRQADTRLPLSRRPHAPRQEQHCRTCQHLSALPLAGQSCGFTCDARVWQRPLSRQSVHTSQHLRLLSLTCAVYVAAPTQQRTAPHHCRACGELTAADTVDERYVCGRGLWNNPMKPQSVANALRLTRLSASCPFFAPSSGRWLSRSKVRGRDTASAG
jgi:hypothetical protein